MSGDTVRADWLFLFLPLPLGFLLDCWLGDPPWLYHPVRVIGGLIRSGEGVLRRLFPETPAGERAAGVILALALPLCSAGAFALLQAFTWRCAPPLWFALETMLSYQLLAGKDLKDESMAVFYSLRRNDLPAARKAVARIVGRDTESLTEEGVARAAVETVAENTSDGVVAPMLYLALFGAAGGLWYKAVNTLDSMAGYKNQRYLHFGWASARLDDLANWLPARAAALMMLAVAGELGFDRKTALRVYRQDRRNHESPNSAQTESVCAGALGVQLGGDAAYSGEIRRKPLIGGGLRPSRTDDIPRANRLMTVTSYLSLLLCCLLRGIPVLLTALWL